MNPALLGAALLAVLAGAASAQSAVYRCGNEYTRIPCSDGRMVETQGSLRTAADRNEGLRIAAAERRLADDMARDRRRDEAEARRIGPANLGPARPPPVAKAAAAKKPKKGKTLSKAKGADGDDFVVTLPKPKK